VNQVDQWPHTASYLPGMRAGVHGEAFITDIGHSAGGRVVVIEAHSRGRACSKSCRHRRSSAYWGPQFLLADYWLFALEVPPVGYECVRDDTDAILVNTNTGEVTRVPAFPAVGEFSL